MIYREEGGVFRVEVISDRVVDGERIVTLKHLETIKRSPLFDIEPEEIWTSACRVGAEVYANWTLSES